MRLRSALVVLLCCSLPLPALAQSGASSPTLHPALAGSGWRVAQAEEPGAPAEEPAANSALYRPEDDPNLKPAFEQEREAREQGKDLTYAVGLGGRFLFVPAGFTEAFTQKAMGLYSGGFELEFVRRMEILDIVASLGFSFYNPPDGVWLGNNKNPLIDADYLQFKTFDFVTLAVTFIGHHWFKPWISLVYGGGVGLAVPVGGIYRMDATNCADLSDLDTCIPAGADRAQWEASEAYRQQYIDARQCPGGKECAGGQYKEDGVWPIYPLLHLLLGVNFKLHDHVDLRVDAGFHNAFYFGMTTHYLF